MDEDGSTVLGHTIAMTDEDVFAIEVIGCAMTSSFILLFISFEEEVATTIPHVDSFTIEIRTIDGLAAPYCHTIIALGALTAVIPRYKEVIIAPVFEDEWCFDSVRSGKVGCGILLLFTYKKHLL